MTALLGGSINVMFVTPPSVMGLIKDGRVRPLAFTGTKPFAQAPEVPLMKDLVPGYESQGSWGMMLCAGQDCRTISPTSSTRRSARRCWCRGRAASCSAMAISPTTAMPPPRPQFFRKEVMQAEEAVKAAGIGRTRPLIGLCINKARDFG